MVNFLAVDETQLLHWVDIGLIIAFAAFLGGILLAFLRGLIRGWKQGTYRIVFLGTLAIVLLCLSPVWINIIGSLPLNSWIASPQHITIQDKSFELVIGTSFDTIRNFFEGFLKYVLEVKMSPAAIDGYAIALAGSIIRLVMVVLIAVVVETVGSLLCWLLWHIAFKRIIPKVRRKPSKRWISGLEDAVVYFCLTALAFVPITGVINAIHNNGELPADSQNETIQLVQKVVDTYEKSIFNQAFFAWTKGSGKDTLDTQIATFFSQNSFTLDNQTFDANIVKEIRVFSQVEGALVAWMAGTNPSDGTVTSLFHTSLLIAQSFYSFVDGGAEPLLNGIVPLTFDIARNLDEIEEDVLKQTATFDTPLAKKNAYARVSQTDYVSVIDDLFQGDYAVATYDSSLPYSESYLPIVQREINSSSHAHELVNSLVSGYVLGQAETNPTWEEEGELGFSMLDLLPHQNNGELDEEAIAGIDWWKEANIFLDVRDRLQGLAPKNADDSQIVEELLTKFSLAFADDPYGLIELIVGQRDDKGEPIADDKGNNKSALCLFDSDLIAALAPYGTAAGLSYLNNDVLTDPEDEAGKAEIDAALEEFDFTTTAEMRVKLRREFGAVLDVAGKTVAHESGAGARLVRDYKNHPGFTIAEDGTLVRLDPQLCQAFMDGVKCVDNSKIFGSVAPVVGEHFVRPMLAPDQALGQLGIKNVDLHCGKLGVEMANILSLGVYCEDLVRTAGTLLSSDQSSGVAISSLVNGFLSHESAESGHQLTRFLDIVTSSKVLNPVSREGKSFVRNENIAGLLNYLFGMIEGANVQISVEDLDLELTSTWDGKNILPNADGRYGENYYISACLAAFVDTKILDNIDSLSGGNTQAIIRYLSGVDIKSLFNSIGASSIMRLVSSGLLDSMLLEGLVNSDKKMDLKQVGVSYKNLITEADWQREGESMQALLDLAIHGLDLSNLDYTNPMVIDMARGLADSGIFYCPVQNDAGDFELDGEGNPVTEYVFPRFLADKLLHSLNKADALELLSDNPFLVPTQFPDTSGTLHPNTLKLRDILHGGTNWDAKDTFEMKKIICSTFYEAVTSLDEPEEWLGTYDDQGILIEKGELDRIQDAFRSLQAAGGMDLINKINVESIPGLMLALKECAKSQILGSVLLPNAIEMALTAEEVPSAIRDANINTGYLYRLGEQLLVYRAAGDADNYNALLEERDDQINRLVDLVNIAMGDEAMRGGDAFSITLGNIDVNSFMRPLLDSASNSKVFHPKEGDTYRRILNADSGLYDLTPWELPETTAFESLVIAFLQKSAVYVDDDGKIIDDSNDTFVKGTKLRLRDIVHNVQDWPLEIDAVCELIELLQSSSFLNNIGDIDLSPLQHLDTFFKKRFANHELNAFFVSISESELFYRCLPGQLETNVTKAMQNMDIENISKDIACADFYYTKDAEGNDFTPYEIEEIHALVDAFEGIGSCLNIDLKDLTTADSGPLSTALLKLGCSKIFNSNTEKSNTQFADVPFRKGMTCYQEMLVDLLMVDALQDYYFISASPKDAYHVGEGHYSNAKTKMAYAIRNSLPALGSTYQEQTVTPALFETIAGPVIEDWRDCIDALKRPSFSGFIQGSASFDDLSEDSISVLLHALNDCALYRDCVPNALYKSLVLDSSVEVEDVDFSTADVYFSYYMQENGKFKVTWNTAKPDFDIKFYEPEIDQLSMLIPLLRDNSEKFQNVKLAGENALDASLMRSILYDVHDSYVFHEAEAVATHSNENTIFRQLMNVFLNKSKIYDQSLETKGAKKYIVKTDMTLHDVVLGVDESEWPNEIENIHDLLVSLQSSDFFVTPSGDFSFDSLSDPKAFFAQDGAKEELSNLLGLVNKGELFYRSLPGQMDKAMGDSFGGSSELLLRIKQDLKCADYYHMSTLRAGDVHDIDPYPAEEMTDLVDLFERCASFTSIDMSNLETVNTEDLREAMKIMGRMEIYNSNTTNSNEIFATGDYTSRQGLTAHQAMLCDVILVDSLESYYYLADSPKDIHYVNESAYVNAKSKIAYNVKELIPVLSYASMDQRAAAQADFAAKSTPIFNEWESCLYTMKTDFGDMINGSVKPEDIEGEDMEKLFKALNDCTFYRDCVPNVLYQNIVGNPSINVEDVDFDHADVFFSYYMHNGNGEFAADEYRTGSPDFDIKFYEPEIEQLSELIPLLRDNSSTFQNAKLAGEGKINPDIMREILYDVHDSYIFHEAGLQHENEDTIFRQLMKSFLTKSKIYEKSLDPVTHKVLETDITLREVVLLVEDQYWGEEIENTYELLTTIQNSTFFVNGDGAFDMSALSDPTAFFAQDGAKAELSSLLSHVNDGRIFYRCLPAEMTSAMHNSFGGGSALLNSIQDDLDCADYYHMATVRAGDPDYADYDAYPADEVTSLVDLFECVSTFTSIDLSNLGTVNTDKLRSAMSIMGKMEIYNSNTTKSVTKFASTHVSRKGLTAHQAMLCDVILVDTLDDYYFLAASPKDIAATASYADADAKMSYNIKALIPTFTYASMSQREAKQAEYAAKADPLFEEWQDCLDTLKGSFGSLISGGTAMEDVEGDDLSSLLHALNDCTFYRDCVPNSLYDTLIVKNSVSVTGVDFTKSDIFFSYYMHDQNGHFSSNQYLLDKPNFDMPFYDNEIDHIADLYSTLKAKSATLSNLDLSVPGVAKDLRDILVDVHDSYILNTAATLHRPTSPAETGIYVTDGANHNFGNLSVFEQFIYKIMDNTTLLKTGYNKLRDIDYTVAYGTDAAEYKMRDRIIDVTTGGKWLASGGSPFGEIDTLTTDDKAHAGDDADPYVGIIVAGQNANIFGAGSATMGMTFDIFEDLSPKKIKGLFYAVNDSYLLGDVLPSSVENLLGSNGSTQGIGMSKYSIDKFALAGTNGETSFDSSTCADFKSGSTYKGVDSLFVALDFDPTANADKWAITIDGTTDISGSVGVSYDAGIARFDLSGLSKPFVLTLNGAKTFQSDISAQIDYSDYYVGQEKFKSNAIPSLGLLLSSVYCGEGKGYFRFGGGGGNLTDFLEDAGSDYAHSTYGLLRLFGDSGFYDETLNAAGHYAASDIIYKAGSMALYNALEFTISANVTINVTIGSNTIHFPNEATISIGGRVGSGTTKASHMGKLNDIFTTMNGEGDKIAAYVREAYWFDHYAADAGTFDLYDTYQWKSLNDTEVDGYDITAANVRSILHNYIDWAFAQSTDAMAAMRKLLDSSRVSYQGVNKVKVPNGDDPADIWEYENANATTLFGNEVLASVLTSFEQNKADCVDLDHATPVTDLATSKRSFRIGTSSKSVEEEKAILRNDYYANDFALIKPAFMTEAKAALTAMEILNKNSLSTFHETLAEAFDAMNVGEASKLTSLFYLATLYDRFLPNSAPFQVALVNDGSTLHDLFHVSVAETIDFAFLNATNHYRIGAAADTEPLFSFAAIAGVIRAAA